jgi:hypothetical protein
MTSHAATHRPHDKYASDIYLAMEHSRLPVGAPDAGIVLARHVPAAVAERRRLAS